MYTICGGIYLEINFQTGKPVSPVTLYTKQSSAHKRCFIRHYMQDEIKMASNISWKQSVSIKNTVI